MFKYHISANCYASYFYLLTKQHQCKDDKYTFSSKILKVINTILTELIALKYYYKIHKDQHFKKG